MFKKITIVAIIILAVIFAACDNGNDLCKDCTKNPCQCITDNRAAYHGTWERPVNVFITIDTNAGTVRLTTHGYHNPCWLQFSGITWADNIVNNAINDQIKETYPTGYRLTGTLTGCRDGSSCIGNDGYFDIFLHNNGESILLLWTNDYWNEFSKP